MEFHLCIYCSYNKKYFIAGVRVFLDLKTALLIVMMDGKIMPTHPLNGNPKQCYSNGNAPNTITAHHNPEFMHCGAFVSGQCTRTDATMQVRSEGVFECNSQWPKGNNVSEDTIFVLTINLFSWSPLRNIL